MIRPLIAFWLRRQEDAPVLEEGDGSGQHQDEQDMGAERIQRQILEPTVICSFIAPGPRAFPVRGITALASSRRMWVSPAPDRLTLQEKIMTKQSKATPKKPITQEAVCRVQSSTAASNGGRQSDYAERLQSVADRRAAESSTGAPAGQRQGSRKAA